MKPNSKYFSAIMFLAATMIPFDAFSYGWMACGDYPQKWRSENLTLYISTDSFPESTYWEQRIQWMIDEWNNVKGSGFNFYVDRDTDGAHDNSNGRSEVYWDVLANPDTWGITYSRWACYWLFGTQWGYKEADIAMNSAARFGWNDNKFQHIMLHELGHALGLMHYNGPLATMNTYAPEDLTDEFTIGHYKRTEPHADDRAGIRYLYSNSQVSRDVSVSAYHHSNQAAAHNKLYTVTGSMTNLATRGQQRDVEYTVENLGTEDESYVLVRFYLSTNNYISTGDTYLGSASWVMPSSYMVTAKARITIPTSISPGTYYMGYITDPLGDIAEADESNNFISLVQAITVN